MYLLFHRKLNLQLFIHDELRSQYPQHPHYKISFHDHTMAIGMLPQWKIFSHAASLPFNVEETFLNVGIHQQIHTLH